MKRSPRVQRRSSGRSAFQPLLEPLEPRLLLSAVAFAPQVAYPTGNFGGGVVSGDFNKDGMPDLAVLNAEDATLSVLLNHGDGTFAPKTDYPTGSDSSANGSFGLATGDFDGNGVLDLVTANGTTTVSVFLNKGDGTFAPHVDYAAGGEPHDVITGDFNGDGKMDLAVAETGSNKVAILLGNGDGTFGTKKEYANGTSPFRLASGDFNGDGSLDVVTANSGSVAAPGSTVSVLLSNGSGTFATPTNYTTGTGPVGVGVGDFNGDGKPDLAVANYGSNSVSVFLGSGTGTFSAKRDFAAGTTPHGLTTGDFNADGKTDLAVADMGDNNVSVLLGNGDGTFAAKADFSSGGRPAGIAAGDFNNDGRLDLASGNGDDNTVNVFLNQSPTAGWVADAPVGTARDQFAAGVVNGKIYIFGGNQYPGGGNLNTAEVFDPATNTWSYAAADEDNGGPGVEEVTGAALNGKFYVFGAYGGIRYAGQNGDFNFNEVYDPVTDTWASIAPKPTLAEDAPCAVYNGEIYVFGGDGLGETHTDAVEAYNPSTNSWRFVTHLPQKTSAPNLAVVGQRAYIIGGFNQDTGTTLTKLEAYDFVTGEWITSGLAPMPLTRIGNYGSAAPVVDGKIYVIGGGVLTGTAASPSGWLVARVDVYDPVSNTWSTRPSLPSPRGGNDGTVVAGNTIYVISGEDSDHPSEDDPSHASPAVWSWQVPANQAPTVSSLSKNVPLNGSLAFTALDFVGAFSDPDSWDTLQKVQITALPSYGILKLNNVAVTQGQEIAVGQLGTLTYTPGSGNTGSDSFGWNGSDGSLYATNAASVGIVTAVPMVDLVPTFGTLKLPRATVVSGSAATILVPVITRNAGSQAVPTATPKMDLDVFARPTGGGADTLLKEVQGITVSALGPTKTVTTSVTVTLPIGLATGTYNLVAVTDAENQIAETNADGTAESNNEIVTAGTITVTEGRPDIAASFGAVTLPPAVISGQALAGSVPVVLKNVGNVATPGGQKVNVQIIARDSQGNDTPLAPAKSYAVNLASNASTTITVAVTRPDGLPPETYQVLAVVTPTPDMIEWATGNNTAALNAAGQPVGIVSAAPFVDLVPAFGTLKLPTAAIVSGSTTTISVPVISRNAGNVPVPSATPKMNLEIFARPTAGGNDVLLKEVQGVSVSALGANRTKVTTTTVTLPIAMAAGSYNLVVLVDTGNQIAETNPAGTGETNNEAVTTGTITVTQGYVDMTGTIGAATAPKNIVTGTTKLSVPVIVKNRGIVPLPSNAPTMSITIVARKAGSPDIPVVTLANQSVAGLAVNGAKSFTARFTLPNTVAAGEYSLVAVVDSAGQIAENNEDNNEAVIAANVNVENTTVQMADYLMWENGAQAQLSATIDGHPMTVAATISQGPAVHGLDTLAGRWYSAGNMDSSQYYSQDQQGFHLQQIANEESNGTKTYDFTSDYLAYPSQVVVGQKYVSNGVEVTRSDSGGSASETRGYNLEALDFESVTTAAGTFFCLKLQTTEDILSDYGTYHEVRTEWLARGVGMVKMVLAGKENGRATESGSMSLLSYTLPG